MMTQVNAEQHTIPIPPTDRINSRHNNSYTSTVCKYPQMTPKVLIRQFQLYELKRNKWIVIVLFTQGNIMITKTKQNSVSQLSS